MGGGLVSGGGGVWVSVCGGSVTRGVSVTGGVSVEVVNMGGGIGNKVGGIVGVMVGMEIGIVCGGEGTGDW